MIQEKITRDDLRTMSDGETKTFELETVGACDSGKVTACTMQRYLGCRFSVKTNYSEKTLTITRSKI